MKASIQQLFHELVDLSENERNAILEQRQVSAEEREELESLLRFDDGPSGGSLTGNVRKAMQQALQGTAVEDVGQCGPYRLVRLLGSGGMGDVYLGERADGEIQQRVAIKLLRADLEGAERRARFLRERQLLASLNHPAIARVMDAGHTAKGRPYLVMEYVDGKPIDEYCASLDLRDRLAVFAQVCDAVAYAHRQLIIHRDLKPSNILVDASGAPKLLDFGIAKLLDDAREAHTMELLMTPSYASPEQARGDIQTTATDVYSLGAVLFRLVQERSPVRPLPDPIADADFIVHKAMREEPEERYASADALATDLRALLDGRPVQARAGNSWYRLRKLGRRHWIPVTATLLTIAGLFMGLYVANRERAIAERRFQQVRQLANKVLALDAVIRGVPGSIKARHEIVAMSQQYLEALRDEATQDRTLALEIATAYNVLAIAQGVPPGSNLGRYADAAESLRKADALLAPVLKAEPTHREALLTGAEISHGRMILAETDHLREEALLRVKDVVDRVESLAALGPMSPKEAVTTSETMRNVALCNKNLHNYQESIRYARRAIQIAEATPLARRHAAAAMSILADSMRLSGDLDGALTAIRASRAAFAQAEFPSDSSRRAGLFGALWREGLILGEEGSISLGRSSEAVEVMQQGLDMTEEAAARDPNDASFRMLLATSARELGKMLADRDPARAAAVFDHGIRRIREVSNNMKARRAESELLARSSYALRRMKRAAEANARIEAAFALLRDTKDYPADRVDFSSEVATALIARADHLADTGAIEQARESYMQLLTAMLAAHPDATDDLRHALSLAHVYSMLATLNQKTKHPADAREAESKRRAIWESWSSKLPGNAFVQAQLRAAPDR